MSADPRISGMFDEAMDLRPEQRAAFLDRACLDAPELRRELESLLSAFEHADSFLEAPKDTLPATLGPYPVERELGRGAMGIVYLATDPQLGRKLALKSLPPSVSNDLRRQQILRSEARALAALSHPNVAHVYALEETADQSTLFLAMEYVPGQPLAELLRAGPLEIVRVLEMGSQICGALEAAHSAGVVHRDLGPMNVRVTPEGWIKVLDFGLAALLSGDREEMTPLVGTPGYMSPEQVQGGPVDVRVDTWALGCLLFECLSGSPAISGTTLTEILEATCEARIPWDRLPDEIPRSIRRILQSCLASKIHERPTNLSAVRHVLDEELLRIRSAPFVRKLRLPLQKQGRGNLPRHANRFVGRADILNDLVDRIQDQPLITLTGTGGTGKTRTALEIGTQLSESFPDGVWVVEFAGVRSPHRIHAAIARSLDLEEAVEDSIEALSAAIGERVMLLILDNCEHLVAALAEAAGHLIQDHPNLRVIATSREALGIPLEQVYPLGTMQLPALDDVPESLVRCESVELFLARTRARNPRFHPSPEELGLISSICRSLDGLPLAIEMAAGHTRTVSLPNLLQWIENDPRSLGQKGRGTVARHRSLEDVIDWSYRLLEEDERRFFVELSIFQGGWSLAAAEAIATSDSLKVWNVRQLLERLVEKSLVEIESTGLFLRYRFLETVRQFAADRRVLSQDDHRAGRERRFVQYFVSNSKPRSDEQGRASLGWLHRIRFDFSNLLAAIELALQQGRLDQAMALGAAVGRWTNQEGHWRECVSILMELVQIDRKTRFSTSPPTSVPTPVPTPASVSPRASTVGGVGARSQVELDRALVFTFVAEAMVIIDRFDEADSIIDEALRHTEALPLEVGLAPRARILDAAGSVDYYNERMDQCIERKTAAQTAFEKLDDTEGLAAVLGDIGRAFSVSGVHDKAVPYYEEALRLSRSLGDEISSARLLVNLARTGQMTGESENTVSQLKEALQSLRKGGDIGALSQCLQVLGTSILAIEGDHKTARSIQAESLLLRNSAGQFRGTAAALVSVAEVELAAENYLPCCEYIGCVEEEHRVRELGLLAGTEADLERIRSGLKTKLTAKVFEAAVARGRQSGFQALVQRACADAEAPATFDSFGDVAF